MIKPIIRFVRSLLCSFVASFVALFVRSLLRSFAVRVHVDTMAGLTKGRGSVRQRTINWVGLNNGSEGRGNPPPSLPFWLCGFVSYRCNCN